LNKKIQASVAFEVIGTNLKGPHPEGQAAHMALVVNCAPLGNCFPARIQSWSMNITQWMQGVTKFEE
jgi:hypothetical protein